MHDHASTVRLRPDLAAGLDELAERSGRTRSELAEEAIAEYLDVQRTQIEGIRAALRDLEAGEPGVAHEEVCARIKARINERLKGGSAE